MTAIDMRDPETRSVARREHLAQFTHLQLLALAQELGLDAGTVKTVDDLIEMIAEEEAEQIKAGQAEANRFRAEVDSNEIHAMNARGPIVRHFSLSAPGNISQTATWVLGSALPEWAEHFLSKNSDYGDQHATIGLGPAAEFVGMWRKMWKLKRAIWEGQLMNGESADEMLNDLIATCFLVKHLLALDEGTAEPITHLGE